MCFVTKMAEFAELIDSYTAQYGLQSHSFSTSQVSETVANLADLKLFL